MRVSPEFKKYLEGTEAAATKATEYTTEQLNEKLDRENRKRQDIDRDAYARARKKFLEDIRANSTGRVSGSRPTTSRGGKQHEEHEEHDR